LIKIDDLRIIVCVNRHETASGSIVPEEHILGYIDQQGADIFALKRR
jgi:hypothetical protein